MSNIKVDFTNSTVKQADIMKYAKQIELIHEELHSKSKDENEFVRMA